jgi:hypothetical protein
VILAGSTFWQFSNRKGARLALVALAALFVLRTVVVTRHWHQAGEVYADILHTVDRLPRGTKLAAAVAKRTSPFLDDPPVMFVSDMAVVRRDAFVNSLFADAGHQPLRRLHWPQDVRSQRLAHIFGIRQEGAESSWTAPDPFERIGTNEYDYFLLVNPQYFRNEMPAGLELIASFPNRFALYRNRVRTSALPAEVNAGSRTVPAR